MQLRKLCLAAVFSAAGALVAQTVPANRYPSINIVLLQPSGGCQVPSSLEQYAGDLYTCDPTTGTWRRLTSQSSSITPASPSNALQLSNTDQTGLAASPNFRINPSNNTMTIGAYPSGPVVSIPSAVTQNWTFNPDTPFTAYNSIATPIVDVRGVGAKVDGVTDDTAAQNSALALALMTGGAVYEPAGTSLMTGSFNTLNAPVRIYGEGSQSVLQVTNGSGLPNVFDLESATGVEVDHLTINCSTSTPTCKQIFTINRSNHIKLHDLNLSGGGAYTTVGIGFDDATALHIQSSDDVDVDTVHISNGGNAGGYDAIVNFFGASPSTRIHFHKVIDDANGADIGIGAFNCQFCTVDSSYINQGNSDHDAGDLCCGYGIMWYSEDTGVFPITSLTGSGTITATAPLVSGNSILPIVGTAFEPYLVGVTGGTGSFSGFFQGQSATSTTFTFANPGSNASGVSLSNVFTGTLTSGSGTVTSVSSFTGLAVYEPVSGTGIPTGTIIVGINQGAGTISLSLNATANGSQTLTGSAAVVYLEYQNMATNNHIVNTAGSGIYMLVCDHCVASNNQLENVVQQEVDSSLPAAGIAINASDSVTAIGNNINGSGQSCIEFANSTHVSLGGETLKNCHFAGIYGRGGSNGNSNFSVGGGNTISNAQYCVFVGLGGNTQGDIGGGSCDTFSIAGFRTSDSFHLTSDILFHDWKIVSSTALPCVSDAEDHMTWTNISCTNSNFQLLGTNTTLNSPSVYNLASGDAYDVFGAQHLNVNSATADIVPNGISLLIEGTQPQDVWFRNFRFTNMSGNFLYDQSPGSGFTGNTHTSTLIDNLSSTSSLVVGAVLADPSPGSGVIPFNDTIVSFTTGTCPAACSVTLAQATTGNVTGDALSTWVTVANGVHLINGTAIGPTAANTHIGLLSNCIQNLDIEEFNISGFSTGTNTNLVDFRGCTNNPLVTNSNLTSQGSTGSAALAISAGVSGVLATNNIVSGTDAYNIQDIGTGTGNKYLNNQLTVAVHNTNTNSIVSTSGATLFGTTGTITGTSLTATCDSGTVTVQGALVGSPVYVSSTTGADVGGAFYLRGSVTSSNTVTVYVCGTGTPSSLAYNVRVQNP